MNRDDALRKIKVCMAIANDWTANENERKTARRQAECILREHKEFIDFKTFLELIGNSS